MKSKIGLVVLAGILVMSALTLLQAGMDNSPPAQVIRSEVSAK